MGVESVYKCDKCGREGVDKRFFNTLSVFAQSYKYLGTIFPDICLCEPCTDEFVRSHNIVNKLSTSEFESFETYETDIPSSGQVEEEVYQDSEEYSTEIPNDGQIEEETYQDSEEYSTEGGIDE